MKVGILVECGPEGLEVILCRRICVLLREETGITFEIDIVPMDDKKNLIQGCGAATATLFASSCDRVVILWDERPAWPKEGERLCWHNDKQDILANLAQAQVETRSVHLVCIERECESWLLCDHVMLSAVLSKPTHKVQLKRQKRPDQEKDPKAKMRRLFKQEGGVTYVDVQYAAAFARCLQNLARLKKCATFKRFAKCVTGLPM